MTGINTFRSALTGSFSVTARPEPIPGDLRVGWGQSLLILVLASSRGQRCSIQKVHFLVHLSRTALLRKRTLDVLARQRNPIEIAIRIEPWVNRAAAFAQANGLVELRDGKVLALSEAGKAASKLIRDKGLLAEETVFLDKVGQLVTEQVVDKIMKMETF